MKLLEADVTVSLFTFVDLYARAVTTADHLLGKASAHAAEQGIDEQAVMGWALIEDMAPLGFQIMVVCNFARQWPARVAGLPIPPDVSAELSLAAFRAELLKAKAYLATLTPEQFEGCDEQAITFAIGNGMEPTLSAGQWLTVFATTNLYFHLSTAYGILRARGVALGKVDLFAAGL